MALFLITFCRFFRAIVVFPRGAVTRTRRKEWDNPDRLTRDGMKERDRGEVVDGAGRRRASGKLEVGWLEFMTFQYASLTRVREREARKTGKGRRGNGKGKGIRIMDSDFQDSQPMNREQS